MRVRPKRSNYFCADILGVPQLSTPRLWNISRCTAQCFVTGTFVFTGLYTARSLIQLNRRIQQTKAALASMKKSLPVATAPVAAVLNLYPAIGGEASQAVEVPRGAAIDGPCQRRIV